MNFNEFEEWIKKMNIPLKEEHKRMLYPMIATKNDVQIKMLEHKIDEIKKMMI